MKFQFYPQNCHIKATNNNVAAFERDADAEKRKGKVTLKISWPAPKYSRYFVLEAICPVFLVCKGCDL